MTRWNERDRELQSRYAVLWPHRKLAAAVGLQPQTISALASAVYPLSVFKAFDLASIQQDFRLLAALAERAGAVILPHRTPTTVWRTTEFSQVVTSFGRFLILSEKVARGARLTDAEMRELEGCARDIEDILTTVKQQARQDRLPASPDDDN